MKKFSALALAVSCSAAAQTPATNPMPDGSRDMYAGLGAISAPRYEGAEHSKVSALPVLQVQWSTGLFISGMSAGMHLSSRPTVEFGPLLTIQPRRTEEGSERGLGTVEVTGSSSILPVPVPMLPKARAPGGNRLLGMDDIHTRVLGGGFFNYYLSPEWRLTTSALYGAGNDRDGARLELGVQRLAMALGRHHSLSLTGGVTIVNQAHNQAYFGVSEAESFSSGNRSYNAAGGLKDVRLGARWNWALSPSWMLTSHVQATRLLGSAKRSPLVERPTNLTVSTAFAYRF